MNHVLEHTSEPYKTLKEIRRILKVGGKLIITGNNSQSRWHKHYQQDLEGLDISRHLYIHSCQSIKTLIEKASITVTKLRITGRLGIFFIGMSHLKKNQDVIIIFYLILN